MRFLMAMAASLMLMLALVGPVAAAKPESPGCSDFGAMGAFLAKDWHPFGQVISDVAHGGLPGYAGVSQLVQAEHNGTFGTWPCAKYATTP